MSSRQFLARPSSHRQAPDASHSRGTERLLFNGAMRNLSWLDNIACQVPITAEGCEYPSSEHYFHAQKFVNAPDWQEAVRKETDPLAAKRLGRSGPLRQDWEEVKEEVMEEAVFLKFSQHRLLRRQLLETHPRELVEHAPDSCWGDGMDGSGRNLLGKVLMRVRQRLRDAESETQVPTGSSS
mmetsp:Transcript_3402/g.6083  ORF Transcript_3402/g.6083 Transcript_3402/m.6083 type:complete len:182 (-) Transcript_3402:10-555(-)